MSCSIASVTSYFIEKEAKNLHNGDVHIAQIPDFEMEYLENHWRIEVGDGSLFCIFHALSFELYFFSDRRFPLILIIFPEMKAIGFTQRNSVKFHNPIGVDT